jgi:hypothetical protein
MFFQTHLELDSRGQPSEQVLNEFQEAGHDCSDVIDCQETPSTSSDEDDSTDDLIFDDESSSVDSWSESSYISSDDE